MPEPGEETAEEASCGEKKWPFQHKSFFQQLVA